MRSNRTEYTNITGVCCNEYDMSYMISKEAERRANGLFEEITAMTRELGGIESGNEMAKGLFDHGMYLKELIVYVKREHGHNDDGTPKEIVEIETEDLDMAMGNARAYLDFVRGQLNREFFSECLG